MEPAETTQPSASRVSGKLVIVAVVVVALLAATTSWYFRYTATHHAAKFWGPEAATIIRDAPLVTIYHAGNFDAPHSPAMMAKVAATDFDISHAPGLIYLRNALLEDHNFDWSTVGEVPFQTNERWGLMFADPKAGKTTTIWLSDDFRNLSRPEGTEMHSVSADSIMAKGLREMFAEFSAEAAKQAAANGAPAASPPVASPSAEPSR
jgi:hypothetical protein